MTPQAPDAETRQDCCEAAGVLERETATAPWRMTQAKQRELIRAALAKDPTLPDLRIARVVGCAATTVARVRDAAGVAPYRRHRDRRRTDTIQVTRRQLQEQIAALANEMARERSLRIEAERALSELRTSPPAATPSIPSSPPPPAARPAPPPPRDSATRIPAQVPTHGRGLPAAVSCEVCGDSRYWTDGDKRLWRCAGCHPPGPGQIAHRAGRW
jgi:hypothetical protein